MKNKDHDLLSTLLAPDFPGGGQLIYDRDTLEGIYRTGRGSFKVRGRYTYDKSQNCIDITQIPPTTNVEVIVEKVIDLVRSGKVKEISDIRDETGIDGLKITIDLKRGTDPDKLMQRLFKLTTLEDSFSCNFNVLVGGVPKVMGIAELLDEWIAFRVECVRRRTYFDLSKKRDKLHLLRGLQAILLDIDQAVAIVRQTELESMVVPNLMEGFGIDQIQAEYVAEIKLRHLNREYILRRTEEITSLEEEIEKLQGILESKRKVQSIIVEELKRVMNTYGQERKTMLLHADALEQEDMAEEIPDYPVHLFFTKEGYFKKITPQSLRMSGDHKLKEGDEIIQQIEGQNVCDLLFFTDRATVYKTKASEFPDTKTSVMGDFIPAKLQMEEGESAVALVATKDYGGFLLFCFENGKIAKVELSAYETKTNRKKLVGAYSDKSPLAAVLYYREEGEVLLTTSADRQLLVKTEELSAKATRNTQGVQVVTLKKNQTVTAAAVFEEGMVDNPTRFRKKIPSIGAVRNA
jgi:DNA gyrase subunit A